MAMSPKQKTLATIVAGVIVAVTPSFFTYLQSRDELKAKYKQTNDEAAAGYKTLVESVKELQGAVKEQHDYIVKLEGHVEALEKMRRTNYVGVGTPGNLGHGAGNGSGQGFGSGHGVGSGSGSPPADMPKSDLKPPAPPDLRPPPPDFTAAQSKR